MNFQPTPTFPFPKQAFSNEKLVTMMLGDISGNLEFLTLSGTKRMPTGLFAGIDFVPSHAQNLSLVSTLEETRGFTVLKRPGARSVPLECDPSFEIRSQTGETALVFITVPTVDIMDITSFFQRTFVCEKHDYRLCLDIPLLKDGWNLSKVSIAQLHAEGCRASYFHDITLEPAVTLH